MTYLSTLALPLLRRWTMLLAILGVTCLLSACSKFDSTQNAHNGPQASAKFFDAQF